MTPECSPESQRLGFEVAVRLEKRIRRMLRRVCRVYVGDPDLADEAWSDVVLERIGRIVELWDPEKGSGLDGHVIRCLRLYAMKWVRRGRRFVTGRVPRSRATAEDLAAVAHDAPADHDDAVELGGVLDELSEFDRWIITKHALEGYTFKELRDSLGVRTKGAVRASYNRAVGRARVIVEARRLRAEVKREEPKKN